MTIDKKYSNNMMKLFNKIIHDHPSLDSKDIIFMIGFISVLIDDKDKTTIELIKEYL